MEYMPLMIRLHKKRCLIAGGGRVALKKALSLLRFGADITVISPEINYGIAKLEKRNLLRWKRKRFSVTDLFESDLVIAATNDPRVNQRIARWAQRFRILYNTVDDPELSGFIFPAIHAVPPLVFAVSTQGSSPALARRIKTELSKTYGKPYSSYVERLSELRRTVRDAVPDPAMRRRIVNRWIRSERLLSTNSQWDPKEALDYGFDAGGD